MQAEGINKQNGNYRIKRREGPVAQTTTAPVQPDVYLTLRQPEPPPGESKVVIEYGTILLHINDRFLSLLSELGEDPSRLSRNPRMGSTGLYGDYQAYYTSAECRLFQEHIPALAVVVNEKVYRKEGPNRVLQRTQTRYIQLETSLTRYSGGPTKPIARSNEHLEHSTTHIVLYLKQGMQAAEISKKDCENSMSRNGLLCYRTNLATVKIERTAADGTVVSGSSGSGGDSIHMDVTPLDGNWRLFAWPTSLKIYRKVDGVESLSEVDYKMFPSKFVNGVVCAKPGCHGALEMGVQARLANHQLTDTILRCNCEAEKLRKKRIAEAPPKESKAVLRQRLFEGGGERASSASAIPCPYFLAGTCSAFRRGSKCGFSHGATSAPIDCTLKTNKKKICTNGSKCLYAHEGQNGCTGSITPPAAELPEDSLL